MAAKRPNIRGTVHLSAPSFHSPNGPWPAWRECAEVSNLWDLKIIIKKNIFDHMVSWSFKVMVSKVYQ